MLIDTLSTAMVTLSYEESDFGILQTRTQLLSETELSESSWQVWGVATVLLGGQNNQNQFYLFDCYHRDGLSVTWSRIDSDMEVNNDLFPGGTRITMSNQISNYLGLYACTTADGQMESLNVTNGVCVHTFSLSLTHTHTHICTHTRVPHTPPPHSLSLLTLSLFLPPPPSLQRCQG